MVLAGAKLETIEDAQGIQARQRIARAIGMQGSHRAVMTCVHGLQKIERFVAAHLATTRRFRCMRRQLRTRSRIVIRPSPSEIGGRVSSGTT